MNRRGKITSLVAFVFMLFGLLILLLVSSHDKCNNHCNVDQRCRDMCEKREYCPFGDNP